MRISDWSSDVCSSDLVSCSSDVHSLRLPSRLTMSLIDGRYEPWNSPPPQGIRGSARPWISSAGIGLRSLQLLTIGPPETGAMAANVSRASQAMRRSEEHTSELQSLMRISYAVFCLNKKNKQ